MIVYTVHEPPDPPADKLDHAAGLAFVSDRFIWSAALFAPIWMLLRQLWLPVLAYFAIVLAGVLLVMLSDNGAGWLALLIAALHLLIGFEAGSIERWTLERKGWGMIGTVAGRSVEECERRFFEDWLLGQPYISGRQLSTRASGLADVAGRIDAPGLRRDARPAWRSLISRG